ncbi:hypothetical protein TKV_c10800 [Thermoanaerobacter kivui]|uniref:Uncharacterized protein n=1 Tax=Thermoanaerobacter kivui TaxID=2325 RepID=A0A097AR11_THEKI|nr:hypothetical protein [Thermoanaerobacter kivui]AIS52254.1 hypothetical protein TKV_c10800 [Thermoanaerobacter kivui]
MKLKLSKIKNFVLGKISYDEEGINEYIQLLFEKFGEKFFEDLYKRYEEGEEIDKAFKNTLIEYGKIKPLKIKKLNVKR